MNTLMIQGTASDAGKSTVVAGLCRVLVNRGKRVAPFKPQNMALNSAVTAQGEEIGRAQALQAYAAKVPPQVDFNPILLKPNSDTGAQVILHGRPISNMEAAQYQDYKKVAMQAVLASHTRLVQQFNCVLVEGAGSPAEINLREGDVANMGFAEEVDCPVVLVANIDKGGVFAHLVGTLALLSESEQNRVKGFIINGFRGDLGLLESGLAWLEEYTQKPVLGVLPYIHDLALDAEDAIDDHNSNDEAAANIAILLLPHTSNNTDFDALRHHPQCRVQYVRMGQRIPPCDLVIIPGSKNVLFDLTFLCQQHWHDDLQRHLRYGGKVLGICGGMQMLGQRIDDPEQVESTMGAVFGLGLADFVTTLQRDKITRQVTVICEDAQLCGYEIHCGRSVGAAFDMPLFQLSHDDRQWHDGFISADNLIAGTYVHGLFDSPQGCDWVLSWLDNTRSWQAFDLNAQREQQLARLAHVCEQHLDINKIIAIMES
ncbi:cobyric acid synthase [Pseudoalteromonas pernae]|uniref:cobyric acid synthase n=1 Tax=Pseudoalteromonas pernae TaxID=3118054 RepID=UPI003241F894